MKARCQSIMILTEHLWLRNCLRIHCRISCHGHYTSWISHRRCVILRIFPPSSRRTIRRHHRREYSTCTIHASISRWRRWWSITIAIAITLLPRCVRTHQPNVGLISSTSLHHFTVLRANIAGELSRLSS